MAKVLMQLYEDILGRMDLIESQIEANEKEVASINKILEIFLEKVKQLDIDTVNLYKSYSLRVEKRESNLWKIIFGLCSSIIGSAITIIITKVLS